MQPKWIGCFSSANGIWNDKIKRTTTCSQLDPVICGGSSANMFIGDGRTDTTRNDRTPGDHLPYCPEAVDVCSRRGREDRMRT